MSQPPGPPAGPPAGPPPPGWGGPPPYPAGPPGPPPKKSHAVEYVVGAFLGGIGLVVLSFLGLGLADSSSSGGLIVVGPLLALAIYVGLAIAKKTRYWGIGLLIGYFLTLILLGGACVALLAVFSASYA